MRMAPDPPASALAEFRASLEIGPDSALARLYTSVVRREHRRRLGTFFTPAEEVRRILTLWDEIEADPPDTVIDVGAGVGVFTADAARNWPGWSVFAVDVNPATLWLLAVRLFSDAANRHLGCRLAQLYLNAEDFTTWLSSSRAPKP